MDTIGKALTHVAERFPHHDAIIHVARNVRLSYGDFFQTVKRAVKGFHGLGVRPGDHVMLWGDNRPEWIVSQCALSMMGAVWLPVDPGCQADDLTYLIDHSNGSTLVLMDKLLPVLDAVRNDPGRGSQIRNLRRVVVWTDGDTHGSDVQWREMLAQGDAVADSVAAELASGVSPGDVASIMYTSGTTGKPKGVMVGHESLIKKSLASAERQGIAGDDRLALFFPLFHMFGNTCICLTGLLQGAALVIPSDSFNPALTLSALEKERCTAIYGAPSMLISIMDQEGFAGRDLSSLQKGIIGGAPCPLEVMKKIVDVVGITDVTIAYGITEASSWVTMTHPRDPVELRVSTIGRPLPGCEVQVKDPRTDARVAAGASGEICTRGGLMAGYYKMDHLTRQVIDQDGWFHTGDLGVMDEKGYVRITGRIKEVIEKSGREIYPTELEDVLYRMADVAEVQVFGVPDESCGHKVAAWIKRRPGSAASEEHVAAFCCDHLKPEDVPDYIKFVDEFPMTRSGKVQKFRLSQLALEEYGKKDS